MTLVGARLLGVRVASAHEAAPSRWFDPRRTESVWGEISVGPAGRGSFTDAAQPRGRRRREQERKQAVGAASAPEDTSMDKSNGIGKFMQLGGVVQGDERGRRWFSLPDAWRAPRVQIMRHREQAGSAEHDDRRTLRMLTSAGAREGC